MRTTVVTLAGGVLGAAALVVGPCGTAVARPVTGSFVRAPGLAATLQQAVVADDAGEQASDAAVAADLTWVSSISASIAEDVTVVSHTQPNLSTLLSGYDPLNVCGPGTFQLTLGAACTVEQVAQLLFGVSPLFGYSTPIQGLTSLQHDLLAAQAQESLARQALGRVSLSLQAARAAVAAAATIRGDSVSCEVHDGLVSFGVRVGSSYSTALVAALRTSYAPREHDGRFGSQLTAATRRVRIARDGLRRLRLAGVSRPSNVTGTASIGRREVVLTNVEV